MALAYHVEELRQLLGRDVLLLSWPWGKKGDKRRWKHLTADAMNDPEYLRRLEVGNIGVALGDVSGGLCSLDIDTDEGVQEFLRLNPLIANTLQSRGKRGCNLWWRVEAPYPPLTPLKRYGMSWGEWRATGSQTIIHGRHPEGHDYKLINKVAPTRIRTLDIQWLDGTTPPIKGGPIANDTEWTVQTELTERTERTEANRSGNGLVACASPSKGIEEALQLSLPRKSHENHKCLFTLARAVKALELSENRAFSIHEKKKVFLKWHFNANPFLRTTQSLDEYWFEFLEAYENAIHPLGVDPITTAWDNANGKSPPASADQFASAEMRLLVSLCRELQALCGKSPFFIASRTVQRLFHHDSHATGARWLKGLCRSGVLKEVEKGGPDTNKATRYRYLPPL